MTKMELHIKSLEQDIEKFDKEKFDLLVANDELKKNIIIQQEII